MKTLVIGDPHFKDNNKDDTDALHDQVIEILDGGDIDLVVVLGDIMHYHGKGDMKTYIRACKFLKDIASRVGKERSYLIIGNHDRVNNTVAEGEEHWFYPLKDHPNYPTIVDEVTVKKVGDAVVGFVPYTPAGSLDTYLLPRLGDVEMGSVNVFYMHQEFKGCSMGSRKSIHGDVWPSDRPFVISGHEHGRHKVGKNIFYTGTPYHTDFGESGDKFLHTITQSDSGAIGIKNIKSKVPKKLTLRMNASEFVSYDFPKNDWIRTKITDSSRKLVHLKSSKKYTDLLNNPKIKIVFLDESKSAPDAIVGAVPAVKMSFLQRLSEKVESDPKLKSLYDDIFGG